MVEKLTFYQRPETAWDVEGLYPLENGLRLLVEEQWKIHAPAHMDRMLSLIPGYLDSDAATYHLSSSFSAPSPSSLLSKILAETFFDPDDNAEVPRAVHLLFSAAGTGKTRKVFDLLSQRWGFYTLSPNLKPEAKRSGEARNDQVDYTLLDPQREFGSRDTYTLYLDAPTLFGQSVNRINLFEPVLISRFGLFREFLVRCPNPTPLKWLWLQISCSHEDPFDKLARLVRLFPEARLGFEDVSLHRIIGAAPASLMACMKIVKRLDPQHSGSHLYFCLDEAQTVLRDDKASILMNHMYEAVIGLYTASMAEADVHHSSSLDNEDGNQTSEEESDCGEFWNDGSERRRNLHSTIDMASDAEDGFAFLDPIFMSCGTAMNIEEIMKAFNDALNRVFDDEPPPQKWKMFYVHDNFPLIETHGDFWALYKQHITRIVTELPAGGQTQQISTSNIPLLSRAGRPLRLESIEGLAGNAEQYLATMTWLMAPLEVRTIQEIVRLLSHVSLLSHSELGHDSARLQANKHLDLETMLDQRHVRSLTHLAYSICHCDRFANPEPIIRKLVIALADHGEFSPRELAALIDTTMAEMPDEEIQKGNLQDLATELCKQLRGLYIRQMIVEGSRVFRGRYRWSTTYIEAIFTAVVGIQDITVPLPTLRATIDSARETASSAAIMSLQRQLKRMHDDRRIKLLEDLYRAGFRAAVLGQPTLFLHPSYGELVTYGFALVESAGPGKAKFKVSEPLAVHAIMDHLRGRGVDEYRDVMRQALIHTQDDTEVQAMFGKATEWYVAAVSRKKRAPLTELY